MLDDQEGTVCPAYALFHLVLLVIRDIIFRLRLSGGGRSTVLKKDNR